MNAAGLCRKVKTHIVGIGLDLAAQRPRRHVAELGPQVDGATMGQRDGIKPVHLGLILGFKCHHHTFGMCRCKNFCAMNRQQSFVRSDHMFAGRNGFHDDVPKEPVIIEKAVAL